ncbi:MAG: transposase [Opitutaceae bacterium]|nr:transposase [Opitutaceae bacterium]
MFPFFGTISPVHSEHKHLVHLQPFSRHPTVFLTVVTHHRRPLLACHEAYAVLVGIWNRSPVADGWFVGRFIVMPDHVHLFARPSADAKLLAHWIQTWKSLSSRQITALLKITPPLWQKDYFDRFLRSADNYQGKWNYVVMNPMRKRLCSRPAEWPWQGELTELRF